MVRQFRTTVSDYTLELPAGKRDRKGEASAEIAARELSEETGYKADKLELLVGFYTTIAFCNEQIDVYLATGLHKDDLPGGNHRRENNGGYSRIPAEEIRHVIHICTGAADAGGDPGVISASGGFCRTQAEAGSGNQECSCRERPQISADYRTLFRRQ